MSILQAASWPAWLQWARHQFTEDVASFASSSPRSPSELDVLVICKESDRSHYDFHVRRGQALTWLLDNNIYYQTNQVHMNGATLAQLPHDGYLSTLTSVPPDSPSNKQESQPSKDDPYRVPNAVRPLTGQCNSQFKIVRQVLLCPYSCGHLLAELQSVNS